MMKKQMVTLALLLISQVSLASFIQVNLVEQKENLITVLADSNGMTLYTFDVDSTDQSNCHGGCLVTWPAFTTKHETLPAPFGVHQRDNGELQVTLNGAPLYFFIGDQKPGDINGDNIGEVWHIINFTN
jgi:predicted lipoprotein with Yx(FWY)xxD motif